MGASFHQTQQSPKLWKGLGARWLIFALMFIASVFAPFLLRVDNIPYRFFGWWLLWPFLALPSEGFTNNPVIGGAVYLREASPFLALAFWVAVGIGFACMTRRLRLGYVFLGAYPAMLLACGIVHLVLYAFGYYAVSSL